MKILGLSSAGLTTLGNVVYGNIVIFHTLPLKKVSSSHSYHTARIVLNEPYILCDSGSTVATLINCSNGRPVRANYSALVEEKTQAELTL